MNDNAIHRCRLMRRLSRSGLLQTYSIFSAEINDDGEPTGNFNAVGTFRGYKYISGRNRSTDNSTGIPAHKTQSANRDTYIMIPRCDLCDCSNCKTLYAAVCKGQYIEINGEKRKVISVEENSNITQTVLLES